MNIPKAEIEKRIECFRDRSRKLGLPLTAQKQAVFAALAATDAHPTAQELYDLVRKDFPKLSFATVYKNLNRFLELGLVQELPTPEGVSRYDACVESHVHAFDLKTGKMSDLWLKEEWPTPAGLDPKRVERVSVVYYLR